MFIYIFFCRFMINWTKTRIMFWSFRQSYFYFCRLIFWSLIDKVIFLFVDSYSVVLDKVIFLWYRTLFLSHHHMTCLAHGFKQRALFARKLGDMVPLSHHHSSVTCKNYWYLLWLRWPPKVAILLDHQTMPPPPLL